MEHERLRLLQRQKFEEQMRLMEEQHAQEESELLNIPSEMRHLAVSAPTTPPRVANILQAEHFDVNQVFDHQASHLIPQFRPGNNGVVFATGGQGTVSDKRSSVNYGPTPDSNDRASNHHSGQGYVGAKSMPASRRGSSDSRDADDILVQNMQSLAVYDTNGPQSKPPLRQSKTTARFGEAEYPVSYNAGLMLDDELDKDINRMSFLSLQKSISSHQTLDAIKFLPNSDEASRNDPYSKVHITVSCLCNVLIGNIQLSASSAALDLAPLSQTPPRPNYMSRNMDPQKSSEWPSFSSSRPENNSRLVRGYTQPQTLNTGSDLTGKLVSTSSTPMVGGHSPVVSRRSSPRGLVGEGVMGNFNTRSVPATPLGTVPNGVTSNGIGSKSGTPALPIGQDQGMSPFVGLGGGSEINNRYSGSNFDSPGGYGLQQGLDDRVSYCPLVTDPLLFTDPSPIVWSRRPIFHGHQRRQSLPKRI